MKVKYGYAYGILQNVTDWTSGSAGTVYWTADAQNPRGQTTQEALGNGVVTQRNFDAVTGWLNSIHSDVGVGTGLQNLSYGYDNVGNVALRQDSSPANLTENFYYDNLHRLDHSTLNKGSGATTNLQMHYDAMGNITHRSDVNGDATLDVRRHQETRCSQHRFWRSDVQLRRQRQYDQPVRLHHWLDELQLSIESCLCRREHGVLLRA